MFGMHPTHIIAIIVVGLLFFFPSQLPKLARALPDMVTEFKKSLREPEQEPSKDTPKQSEN